MRQLKCADRGTYRHVQLSRLGDRTIGNLKLNADGQIRQTDEYTGISGTQKSKLFLQVDMKAACYSRQAARFCSHAIIDKRRHVRQLRQSGIYRQKHAAKEGIKADKQASISARTTGWIGEIGRQVLISLFETKEAAHVRVS
ncbi:hypothetical protein DPMN_191091 [Dreissena polymorpha]|uniref:Uncharacterized protein n=1 Tax=Dreissena polymorpha TaxID=45954 RepID=A0A9D3XZA7_DREPO|nr:hypothetical protein DPMN_191091 [Dreissena polymorpha]